MNELLAIAAVCLTGAAMTVTILVLGVKEDIIPARNAMFIRIPALMLGSLVSGSLVTSIFLVIPVNAELVKAAFLFTFCLCLGELLFLSVYLLRVPVFVTVFGGRYWKLAGSRWFWLFTTIVLIMGLSWALYLANARVHACLAFTAVGAGWLLSICLMFPYVFHGFDSYEELFSAKQFYEVLEQRTEEFLSMRVASQTPIMLLPTESDPAHWPLPGRNKHPERSRVFAAYKRYAECGLPILYMFNESTFREEIRDYFKYSRENYVNEVREKLRYWDKYAPNLEFRMACQSSSDDLMPGHFLYRYPLVAETSDERGIVIRSARGRHSKIRHAEIIRSPSLTRAVTDSHTRAWANAETLTLLRFDEIVTELENERTMTFQDSVTSSISPNLV